MSNTDEHRALVEAAYARLREALEAKDVSVEGLRAAALEALDHARVEVEVELEDSTAPGAQAPGAALGSKDVK